MNLCTLHKSAQLVADQVEERRWSTWSTYRYGAARYVENVAWLNDMFLYKSLRNTAQRIPFFCMVFRSYSRITVPYMTWSIDQAWNPSSVKFCLYILCREIKISQSSLSNTSHEGRDFRWFSSRQSRDEISHQQKIMNI